MLRVGRSLQKKRMESVIIEDSNLSCRHLWQEARANVGSYPGEMTTHIYLDNEEQIKSFDSLGHLSPKYSLWHSLIFCGRAGPRVRWARPLQNITYRASGSVSQSAIWVADWVWTPPSELVIWLTSDFLLNIEPTVAAQTASPSMGEVLSHPSLLVSLPNSLPEP